MSGYRRCLSIRHFNTSSTLLNTVAATRTSTAPSLSTFIRSGRRVLSEDDRRRTTSFNRRTNAVTERVQQVRDERRSLIERHRGAIEGSEQNDLQSIVDMIEFNSYTTNAQLDNVLYMLNKNPSALNTLNDRQLSILIQAGGDAAQNVSFHYRKTYVEKLWQKAAERKADIGILSYNARIEANIDNRVKQNVVEILQELSAADINANEHTFCLLAKVYAYEGQTAGILNIIELLKEQNLPATQPLFESLVYSFAYNKEDERVKTICQSLSSNPAINVPLLYIAAATAKARVTKDIDEVLKILVDIPKSANFDRKEHLSKILKIVVVLLENGVKGVVPKLQHYLYFDHARGTIPYSYLAEKAAFKLFKYGNEAGALELFPVLDYHSKSKLREFFVEQLKQSVFSSPEKAVELADIFREGQIFKKPLARVVQYAYFENKRIFPFYQKFIESSEFKEFEDRSHLYYPLILNLCSQISALNPGTSERQQLFNQLFDVAEKCKLSDLISKKIADVLESEAEDLNEFSQLIQNNKASSFKISSIIAESMIYNNQLEKLEALLDGPLVNETILLIRILPTIIRSLNRPGKVPDSEIRTIAKVITAGFPENRTNGTNDFGYRAVQEIFKNRLIPDERLSTLVQYLIETPKVSLRKEEIQRISSELHVGNHTARIELLKQLQSKSKTTQRWLNSSFEHLEKEAEFLNNNDTPSGVKARLYGIMSKKLIDDTSAKNGKQILEILKKYNSLELEKKENLFYQINIALRRCLLNKEMDAAKELWEMKKDVNDDVKLLYSLSLLDNGEIEEAEKVLGLLKHAPNISILNQIMDTDIASVSTLEKFVNIIGPKFNLESYVRRQLTKNIKYKEIHHAIKEDNLEKAFNVVKTFDETNREVFGQLDLMAACIQKGNKPLLAKIFEIIVERYDRNTATIDLMIAFLESGSSSSAEQVYKKAKNLFLSNAKTEFLIDREKKLGKPDVLHKLFLICTDPDSLASSDAKTILEECMNLYCKLEKLDELKVLQNDIEKAKFVDDFQKLKAHLDALISKVSSKKEASARRRSASTTAANRSMSRNNSVFEPTTETST
uniref:Leucine-rich PPR motif-containing protein, mitochondrial n=1 Tax=Panagrolaimus sp. PS1159 TaxID=55785 RepID=A0AC35F1Z7_9BILA